MLASLIEGLKQSDPGLAYECVFAMNFLKTNAAPALPELSKVLRAGDQRIAPEAATVLAQLGDPGFAPLRAAATDANRTVRLSSLNALADLIITSTNHLEASLGILTNALKNADADARQAALNSLRRIGVERDDSLLAKRIAVLLTPCTKDPETWVRSSAEDALKELSRVDERKGSAPH